MNKEKRHKILKESLAFFAPLSLLVVSLLSVSFSNKDDGVEDLMEHEIREYNLTQEEEQVARKLISFGFIIDFELIEIELPNPIKAKCRGGEKRITGPDFHFVYGKRDFYIEVGSRNSTCKNNNHKKDQRNVMREVVKQINEEGSGERITYVQLFGADLKELKNIETQSEFMLFLFDRKIVISTL